MEDDSMKAEKELSKQELEHVAGGEVEQFLTPASEAVQKGEKLRMLGASPKNIAKTKR